MLCCHCATRLNEARPYWTLCEITPEYHNDHCSRFCSLECLIEFAWALRDKRVKLSKTDLSLPVPFIAE